jgi:hypothetical protein
MLRVASLYRFSTFLILLFAKLVLAQSSTGFPPLGRIQVGSIDAVNLANTNVHLAIPIISKKGRGIPFSYSLNWDSTIWMISNGKWAPLANWGWRGTTEAIAGYLSNSQTTSTCQGGSGQFFIYSNFIYHDSSGTQHTYSGSAIDKTLCPLNPSHTDLHSDAVDDSGYHLDFTFNSSSGWTGTVRSVSGTAIVPPVNNAFGSATITNRNGNYISALNNAGTVTFTDTMGQYTDASGQKVLTVSGSGTPTSPMLYKYVNPRERSPRSQ